jgi:hypothetical protein
MMMARLWSKTAATAEGKYLVQRRDGTVPDWPYFVMAAADVAAPAALRAYADAAEQYNMDPEYVADIRELAAEFAAWRLANGAGDPDAPRHRTDDPAVIERMRAGRGA